MSYVFFIPSKDYSMAHSAALGGNYARQGRDNNTSNGKLIYLAGNNERPNFSFEERQIVLRIVQEIRNKIKSYGNLLGASYGVAMDEIYEYLRSHDMGFKNHIMELEERYGGYTNVKSLIYGIKRCKSEEGRERCFERHYKHINKAFANLHTKDDVISATEYELENTFMASSYQGEKVKSFPEGSTQYFTEGGQRNQGGGAYAVRGGEIINPADARSRYDEEDEQ